MYRRLLVITLIISLSCSPESKKNSFIESIEFPGGQGSGQPNLLVNDTSVYLSWIHSGDTKNTLYFSVLEDNRWTKPEEIISGNDWFVNWADFPSMFINGNRMYAHFLEKSDTATFSYDVKYSTKEIHENEWSKPVKLHQDTMKAEHGFVSFFQLPNGNTGATWLDGRYNIPSADMHHGSGATSLGFAELNAQGQVIKEELIDNRICDCCQTTAISTPSGVTIAYRDRFAGETRDISLMRLKNDQWEKTEGFSQDQWKIAACPVNGPSMDDWNDRTIIVWFTEAEEQPKVQARISNDGGESYGPPIRIDTGNPIGRVDALALPEGYLISWMERRGNEAEIRVQWLNMQGEKEWERTVSKVSASRSTGFPRMVWNGEHMIMAWVNINEKKVETIRLEL